MSKKFFVLGICCLLCASAAFSQEIGIMENNEQACKCNQTTKCLDLMTSMYNERATLYNVLNLSNDQQKCKDVIDQKRYEELGKLFKEYQQEEYVLSKMCEHSGASESAVRKQEKVIEKIKKEMQKTADKYDKEFKSILNSEQKAKYNTVTKMKRKEIKYCMKNKAFYERDPKLRPFGQKMYYGEQNNVLCPVHKKWHLFGFKHKPEQTPQTMPETPMIEPATGSVIE